MTDTTKPDACRELKPCPFCGTEASIEEHPAHEHSPVLKSLVPELPDHPGSFTAVCPNCECGMIHSTRAELVAAWNARAPVAAPSEDKRDEWMPIATLPQEGKLIVAAYNDPEDGETRHEFDWLEDGVWQKHYEHYEYCQCVAPLGSRIPKEKAPYTHWIPLPDLLKGET